MGARAKVVKLPVVTVDEVTKFAQLCSQKKDIVNEYDRLRTKIVDAYDQGIDIPATGPYRIKFTEVEQAEFSATMIMDQVIASLPEPQKSAAIKLRLKLQDCKVPNVRVSTEANPDWGK